MMSNKESIGIESKSLYDEAEDTVQDRSEDVFKQVRGEPRRPIGSINTRPELEELDQLGSFYFNRFQELGDVEDLKKSLDYRSQAFALTEDGHPDISNRLAYLSWSYTARYRHLGGLDDLERSLKYRYQALALTPEGHPDMPRRLADISVSYADRYQGLGVLDDLEKSLHYDLRALALTPDGHPDMPSRLTNLSWSHTEKYRRLGELEDLEKSLKYRSQALALTPDGHPDMPGRLADLSASHNDRYQRMGDLDDLDKSLDYYSHAVALTHDGHPDMPRRLADLSVIHTNRYQRLGELDDLEESLKYLSQALELTPEGHPDMSRRLSDLSCSYIERYRRLGELDDLDRSLEHYYRALTLTPDDHPDMPRRLADLSASYTDRYRRLGELDDLEKSLDYISRALALTPDGHPDMPRRLADLSTSHIDRYQRLGELNDLEESLEYSSRALALTPDGHPDMPRRLADLSLSYIERYRRLGDFGDLEKSLDNYSRALALTPDGHPHMPRRLADLSTSHTDRYQRLGELNDLEKSLEYYSRALALTPDDHPDMPRRLADLSWSYIERYRRLGDLDDFEKSLDNYSRALALTPDGHPDMPSRLADLSRPYTERYGRLGELDDLEKSLKYNSRAITLTPDAHPELSQRHRDLAISRLNQFQRTGNLTHSEMSLSSFRVAAQLFNALPRDRFHYALEWARNASKHGSLNPMEAYQITLDLLPQFIWLGATTSQRYHDLAATESLAVNAASVAIRFSEHSRALEWLEHARCVVWNQSLMLRSPLDQLHSIYPNLATKLQTVASQLHNAGFKAQTTKALTSDSISLEQVGQQRRRLATEYHNLLSETRRLPGFEDFLQPKKCESLMHAARNGPIVVINCHEDRCDALFILPGNQDIYQLPLHNFTEKMARSARSDIGASLRRMGLRERGVRPWQQAGYKDRFESVLVTLWNDIVKPVLEFLGYMGPVSRASLPHITWCPTGALTFLPLHAAGDYTQPHSRVFDYVISSYTPTLTALLSSVPSPMSHKCRVLGIGQANTPGHNQLPGTVQELSHLKAHVQNSAEYSQLIDDQATTTAVLDAMEQHDWVHLACHAHQNARDPTKSGFFLHDGTLDLASINQRSFKNKGLAFLSACQTAKGDQELPDEAIHLASGMLIAGYPSVIATMWSVSDQDAPLVADKVYSQLMKDGKIGNGEAGKALHFAITALREKVGEKAFGRWVPYIHIGS